ncbi:hypothetical protein Ccrd_006222 [Cynara cardunculus var. scolymus]|uniref:Uncharacterized protein n=1 Tax=Cynara cardunculus var. scolymus TaxID=59895 RepID=A0A118JUU7_CYNCS|nr:hypothetical protein Ccrd_006222 [Cynara cardunculus var. scolymus]
MVFPSIDLLLYKILTSLLEELQASLHLHIENLFNIPHLQILIGILVCCLTLEKLKKSLFLKVSNC